MKTEYGLIGERLAHSFSVPIHNMLTNNDYSLCEIPKEDLESFMRLHDFRGINVTIPYKTEVIKYLDDISDTAQRIGSVNTIVNRAGKLYGDNTDYYGFSYMAKKAGIAFKGKKTLILGSGGTSLTARAVAQDEGAKEIIVVSRRGENNYDNISLHSDADIIINTTPVGMYPRVNDCPVSLNDFKNLCGVIDVIYNPIRTDLLISAKSRGIAYTNGLPMLVAQAKRAHELFFDTKVESSEITRIIKELEFKKQNIVLVGMPGCGKTTLAEILSHRLNREMLDTDRMIVEHEGENIPAIFRNNGENYFRQIEAACVQAAGEQYGKVIATGGGVVLSESNRRCLLHNGLVIWLKRPLSKLERKGRPLSSGAKEIEKIYEERAPFYEKISDISIDISDDPKESADMIIKMINN